MHRLLFLFLILPIISVCQEKTGSDGGYINHDKWKVDDAFGTVHYELFLGKPKQVKEISYIHLDDSTITSKGRFAGYRLLKFDASGNLEVRVTYVDSNHVDTMKTWYDRNGRQQVYTDYWYPNISRIFHKAEWHSQRIAPGKFRHTFSVNGRKSGEDTVVFLSGGDMIRRESIDGSGNRNSTVYHYQGDRLIETETTGRLNFYNAKYFYSDKGFLDSVHIAASEQPLQQFIFRNNSHGDPVYIAKIRDGRISMIQQRWYEYDSKGNWTRQLNCYENYERPDIFWYDRFYKSVGSNRFYSLVVREISY